MIIIFIRNIPQNTTKENIHKFVSPTLRKLGIIRLGNIQKIDILGIVNKNSGNVDTQV